MTQEERDRKELKNLMAEKGALHQGGIRGVYQSGKRRSNYRRRSAAFFGRNTALGSVHAGFGKGKRCNKPCPCGSRKKFKHCCIGEVC